MKYFFDTEFIEDGHTIDLISIGIVCEDGRELYAVSQDADYEKALAHDWVREHVLSQLPHHHLRNGRQWVLAKESPFVMSRGEIRELVLNFVDNTPEFWAYYGAYDWIVMCQLFGKMIDLPEGWPMYCNDIKQVSEHLGGVKLPEQESGEHNALEDARWNALAYRHFEEFAWAHPEMWRL
jgi:3' exoribonuclease, RNase T-like